MDESTKPAVIGAIGAIIAAAIPSIIRKLKAPKMGDLFRIVGYAAVGFCIAATTAAVFVMLRHFPNDVAANYPDEIIFCPENQDYWARFLGYLNTSLNHSELQKFSHKTIKATVFISENYGELLDNLKKNRVQVCALSAGTTATAVLDPTCHYDPMFELCSAGTNRIRSPINYHAVVIVNTMIYKDGVTNFQSLVDKLKDNPSYKFGLGQETSHSSYRVPALVLKAFECPDTALKRTTYSHNRLIECVRNRTENIIAACVASDVYDRWKPDQKANAMQLEWPANVLQDKGLIYLTHDFPSVSFGWRNDLPVPLQLCLHEVFATYDWTNDPNFMDFYKPNNPGVVGVIDSDNFWTRWGDVFRAAHAIADSKDN